jgi:beta-glucosidase-like glycosyl hydrolase
MSMQAVQDSENNITLRVKRALIAGCDMVLVCNSPIEIDKLMGELQWRPDVKSLERLQLMKLNRDKNNLTCCNHTINEARSIIKQV